MICECLLLRMIIYANMFSLIKSMSCNAIYNFFLFTAVVERGVELKILVNEHATHKYLMKKYLRRLSEKIKDKKRYANVQLKYFSVSIIQYFLLYVM